MDDAETASCGLEIQQIPFYCGRGVAVNPCEKFRGHLFSGSCNKIMMQFKLVSFFFFFFFIIYNGWCSAFWAQGQNG